MPGIFTDGKGRGYLAEVDSSNRLNTYSVATQDEFEANRDGDAYNINTGVINLTDAAETPVLYLKNNENNDLHIRAIAIGLATSSNGASNEMIKATVIRNPTAGTIVSSSVNVDINSNRNYGSNKTLTSDAYKGATGKTMTDGTDHIIFYASDFGRLFGTIDEVIPKGSSIGIKLTPPTGNTYLPCYVALISHLDVK